MMVRNHICLCWIPFYYCMYIKQGNIWKRKYDVCLMVKNKKNVLEHLFDTRFLNNRRALRTCPIVRQLVLHLCRQYGQHWYRMGKYCVYRTHSNYCRSSYRQFYFERFNVSIIVLSDDDIKEPINELAKDLLSIVTVFTTRYYGSRSYKILSKNKVLPKPRTDNPIKQVHWRSKVLLQQGSERTKRTRTKRIVESKNPHIAVLVMFLTATFVFFVFLFLL